MRKLVLKMSMSLDGFVVAEKPDSDWMIRAGAPDSAAWVLDTLAGAGAHVIGRKLFESWITIWPASPSPMAEPLNTAPKVVFTRQSGYSPRAHTEAVAPVPPLASWAEARVVSGDLATEVEALKQEPGGYLLAQGGVGLARALVAANLVDEYRLVVCPVALGRGEPLFSDLPGEFDLTLVESTAFSGGVLGNVYVPTR